MNEKTTLIKSPGELTERFINQTNRSVFLTGKAGTGKTTLLKKIIDTTHKNTVVVAPTGIAALNAGGVTIHSFFQLPFGGFLPITGQAPHVSDRVKLNTQSTMQRHFRMNKQRQAIIRNLELLIIDEVSMLRADLLDAIDFTLRKVRRSSDPFGGVQVLFIGDLLQLPPIVKPEEKAVLSNYYNGFFFFHAKVLERIPPLYVELEKIYRQDDEEFIEILNHLRNNFIDQKDVDVLNKYVKPDFKPSEHEGYITLTTHNNKADQINQRSLDAIKGKSNKYRAEITGDFPSHIFPIAEEMELKVGAQVMFIKNDTSFQKNYFNGKIGTVSELSHDSIFVNFPEEQKTIEVEKYEWENVKFTLDEKSGEIQEEVKGTFVHFPLKLAWAITVHKSQGLTFDKAVLDLSNVFASGQAYVGLSRLRSLKGLVLLSPIQLNGLSNDRDVVAYAENKASQDKLNSQLEDSTILYLNQRLSKAFNWDGMVSKWLGLEHMHKTAGDRSEMGRNRDKFVALVEQLTTTLEPSRKFRSQLFRICQPSSFNIDLLAERVEAAYHYFMKTLEPVFRENLKQILLLGNKKSTKQYVEELRELDELLTTTILDLKKSKALVEQMARGAEINRASIWNDQVKNFKMAKMQVVKDEIRRQNPSTVEIDDSVLESRSSKPKKEKKKSTYERTFELFQKGWKPAEIADQRNVTTETIFRHLGKLIQDEKIEVEQVLDAEKLNDLRGIFGDEIEGSLSEAKEKIGNKYSWAELKIFHSSLLK
jgi:uncharacterized protein YpbB